MFLYRYRMYRYIIYNRVSTTGQTENTSVQHQETLSRAYADAQGWHHADSVSVTESGASLERAGVERVFGILESGKGDVVVFAKVDRIGRSQQAFVQFFEGVYQRGGMIAIATEGKLYPSLLELQRATVFHRAMAEHEWLTINERTQQGKRDHLSRGSFLKKPAYGYTLTKVLRDGVKVNVPVPLDEEARVLTQLIIPRFLLGTSRREITAVLNERGVPTRTRNSSWTISTITRMLQNVGLYAGESFEYSHTVGGEVFRLRYSYPPLITPKVAEQVRRKLITSPKGHVRPFTGVLRCGSCGEPGATGGRTGREVAGKPSYGMMCRSLQRESYRKKVKHRVHVEHVCRGMTTHQFFEAALRRFLTEDDRVLRHLDAFVDATFRLDALVDEQMAREEKLLAERRELRDRALALSGENLLSVARALEGRMAELDRELDGLSAGTMRLKRELDGRRRSLAQLGVRFPNANTRIELAKMRWQYQLVERRVGRILAALDEGDWRTVNEGMLSLGLTLVADFGEQDAKLRRENIRVEMRLLPPSSEHDDLAVYRPYPLEGGK